MAISPTTIWLDRAYSIVDKKSNIEIHFSLCKIDPYLITFRDTDKCFNYIHERDDEIILIISDKTSADRAFLQQCEELSQINSVYILSSPDIQISQTMSKPCEIYTNLESLCIRLWQLPNIRRCRREDFVRDDFNINVIRYSSDSSALSNTTGEMTASSSSLNDFAIKQHEIDSIYAKLFEKILVRIDSTAEKMIQFCREKYADDENVLNTVNEFEAYYDTSYAIFWYTRDTFLYRLLNKALREQELDTLYSLRYFIKDLDSQLAYHGCLQRLASMFPDNDDKTESSARIIYRGQLMANEEFNQRIRLNIGGFLSINSFFSTTAQQDLAMIYAGNRSNNETSTEQSVLFRIEVSYNYQEYANISKQSIFAEDEKEILFTMGAVFRIVSAHLKNEGFWEVNLRLDNKEDFELATIAGRLEDEIISHSPLLSLGRWMFATANYDKAKHYHKSALIELILSEKNDIIPAVLNGLGATHNKSGELEKAIDCYQKSLNACVKYLPPNDSQFARVYNNIGMTYRQRDDYNKALSNYNKALEIELNSSIPDTSETAIYHNNIGGVYFAQERYTEALKKFEECLQSLDELRSVCYRLLAIPYNNIAQVHYVSGKYDKASRLLKKTIEIQLRSLPLNHPDLAISYNNLGWTYEKQGQSQEAREMHEKAQQIQLKSVPTTRLSIVTTTYTIVAEFISSTT